MLQSTSSQGLLHLRINWEILETAVPGPLFTSVQSREGADPHLLQDEDRSSSAVSLGATSHVRLFKFKLIQIKQKSKLSFSVAQATFQVLDCYMWLVAAILDNADYRIFPPSQEFLFGSHCLEGLPSPASAAGG